MRLTEEVKKVLTISTSAVGFISSVIEILTASYNHSIPYIGFGILITTILVILIIRYIIPKDNLPDGFEDIDELDNQKLKKRMKIVFPCDSKYYEAANELAKDKFGKNSVSTKTVNDWKKRNELNLTCLTDNKRMVGYFDILPLRKDFALKLINGDVGEKDIRAEDVLGVHEMKDAEYLYFAGIAVQHTDSYSGFVHATCLVCAAILYIRLFYENSHVKKILTIPTNPCGLKITEHLNFSLEREGKLRRDGYDIYSQEFNINAIEDMIRSKKRHYQTFNFNGYLKMYQKITGQFINLPINA